MLCCLSASAQRSKMTSFVQKYAEEGAALSAEQAKARSTASSLQSTDSQSAAYDSIPKLLVLVRCSDTSLLAQYGCSVMCNWNDIYAVNVPITKLDNVAALPEVERIEANEPSKLCNNISAKVTHAYDGWAATFGNTTGFTGEGVIMGIVDCGFDFTNPTFRTADNKNTRIKRVWDMLDTTSNGSTVTATSGFSDTYDKYHFAYPTDATYPGRQYTTSEEITTKTRSLDADSICHATHVLGTAAGNGVPSIKDAGAGKYKGMAPEAEIVAVANATLDNQAYWKNNTALNRYSNTYDLLAFKYIFDYADSQKKPCVLNVSQGWVAKDQTSNETGKTSYQLQTEIVQSMLGPGHILCAAAGNSEDSAKNQTNTICFPACIDGVIGVGNVYYGSYNGEYRAYQISNYTGKKTGEIVSSSGRGPAPLTGTLKPDVVAPGMCIMSALDHYFSGKVTVYKEYVYTYNGVQYKWANMNGTSMATPVVSGIVAQWLQLCPTLTPEQVLDVIKNTSTQDQEGVEYPNNSYGYGCINALEGLKYIAKVYTGIETVSADGTAEGTDGAPQYYDLLGRKVSESQAHGGIFLVRQGTRTVKVAR